MSRDKLIDLITVGIARACVKEANGEQVDKAIEIADVLLENQVVGIETMAKDICMVQHNCNDVCNPTKDCRAFKYAERAYDKGYRKASDVAEEIFAEIEQKLLANTSDVSGCKHRVFAELKKKYTEELK